MRHVVRIALYRVMAVNLDAQIVKLGLELSCLNLLTVMGKHYAAHV